MTQTLTSEIKHAPTRSAWQEWLPDQTELQDAIHKDHHQDRDRYIEVLASSPYKQLRNQAIRMATCAASVHLYFSATAGTVREYLHTCKSRICPLCGRRRSIHVAKQLTATIARWKRPRHIVLTVKSKDENLRSQVMDLLKWFGKLRRLAWWKQNVSAGVYTIEITINERTGLWHPHLHILYEGQYIPQAKLRYHWHTITNGSEIVWIEEVYSAAGAANELCKYIGKPQNATHWTDNQLHAYALAVAGLRMVQPFGTRTPTPIIDETPDPTKAADETSISLASLIWLAKQDNTTAAKALVLIAQRWDHLGRYIHALFPQLDPDKTQAEKFLAAHRRIEQGTDPPPAIAAAQADLTTLDRQICTELAKLQAEEEATAN